MDLITRCKDKLGYFRVKELKDVLTQLGLAKKGKKQDLVDRILAALSEEQVSGTLAKKKSVKKEEVAKLIDDTHRKMQVYGEKDLASKTHGVSYSKDVKYSESYVVACRNIRCPCESSLETDSMIKCEDPRCHVWQHIGCVIIAEKHMKGVQPVPPELFYCEICRLSRADPFWVTVAHPLCPVKLPITKVPAVGDPMLSIEKTFLLTRADKDLLSNREYGVQAWCILLNDKVPFRMQWPQYAELHVNAVPVQAINRPSSQLLGANGRDNGPVITNSTRDGLNKISLTACDARIFCLGVRIVKRRTLQQILNLIPKESDGEKFEDALSRVRRCVGGGTSTENTDSDRDLEVVAHCIRVNLCCPMSGLRIKVAGRFKPCAHMGCFDLEVFVEMNEHSRKWQCPICLKNYSLENIIIDPYFNRITSKMWNCEDVKEIEVKPDGSWRAKTEGDCRRLGELGQWHLPDGSISVPVEKEAKPKSKDSQQIMQEDTSEGHTGLRLGIKKNRDGFWEVSKAEDMHTLSYSSISYKKFDNHAENIHRSSSATGSGRDGEDPSVNQDAGGNFDSSANNGIELKSITLNSSHTYGFASHEPSALSGENEVIILSDSDEDNQILISSDTSYEDNQTGATGVATTVLHHVMSESSTANLAVGTGVGSCMTLSSARDDEFTQIWSLPPRCQGDSCLQLVGSDILVDVLHNSINCPTSVKDSTLTAEPTITDAPVHGSFIDLSDANMDAGDKLLPFGQDGFVSVRSSDASVKPNSTDHLNVSNGICINDCVSFGVEDSGSRVHGGPASTNELNSRQRLPSKGDSLDSSAIGTNGNKSVQTSRALPDNHYSFCREQRSVRPRLYLSIDSDSE